MDGATAGFVPCAERGRALMARLASVGCPVERAERGHIFFTKGFGLCRALAAIEAAGGEPNAGRDVEFALADVSDYLCSLRLLIKRWQVADWDAVKHGLAGPDGESIAARFRAAEEAAKGAARAPAGPGYDLSVESRYDALRAACWAWDEAAVEASGKSEGAWTDEQWARAMAVDVLSVGRGVDGRPGGVGSLRVVDIGLGREGV
jgi:hypothetical protein